MLYFVKFKCERKSIINISNAQIAALLVEHPDAKVVPMVSQQCWNEDFHWTMGTVKKVEVDAIYEVDERLYIASKDEEELELNLSEQAVNQLAEEGIPFKENMVYEETFKKLKNKVTWQKAIILYIE